MRAALAALFIACHHRYAAGYAEGCIVMKTFVKWNLSCAALLAAWLVWLGWFSVRPPLMTDPAALVGDGSALNYCELPVLDGSGRRAVDIPKGNTPGCGYDHFPLPILAACTEPLSPEADDIRGLWRGVSGEPCRAWSGSSNAVTGSL